MYFLTAKEKSLGTTSAAQKAEKGKTKER